ncbi:hypothetical protein [Streptomyces inhibens]|uniref:hypothetical protein n=1 Tax=Streptomyces inhibens TaxID=2293571 RepID=UPI000FFBD214|nr:hypothetical protein [Streptomyces inhibens]
MTPEALYLPVHSRLGNQQKTVLELEETFMVDGSATPDLRAESSDPFLRPFITAADGRLQVFHRRPTGVIEQEWSVDLHTSGTCTNAKPVDGNQQTSAPLPPHPLDQKVRP